MHLNHKHKENNLFEILFSLFILKAWPAVVMSLQHNLCHQCIKSDGVTVAAGGKKTKSFFDLDNMNHQKLKFFYKLTSYFRKLLHINIELVFTVKQSVLYILHNRLPVFFSERLMHLLHS